MNFLSVVSYPIQSGRSFASFLHHWLVGTTRMCQQEIPKLKNAPARNTKTPKPDDASTMKKPALIPNHLVPMSCYFPHHYQELDLL